jgi:hypothetical protein
MILSNSAIFAALDDGRLIIDPEPSPRNPADEPNADWPYGTSAVDLRLVTKFPGSTTALRSISISVAENSRTYSDRIRVVVRSPLTSLIR